MTEKTNLLEACKLAENLIERINWAFYVKGKTKDLLPVMGETKAALGTLRNAIREATMVEVESFPIICEGKTLEEMGKVFLDADKTTQSTTGAHT